MATSLRGRPLLPVALLLAFLVACFHTLGPSFSAPLPQNPVGKKMQGRLTGALLPAFPGDSYANVRVPQHPALAVASATVMLLDTAWIGCAAASMFGMFKAWKRKATDILQDKSSWDNRRLWTAVNVGNHGIYAILFIIRSFFYTGLGSHDRPFFYESYFLGWLCGPSWFLPTLLGWDNNQYNRLPVLHWVTKMNSGAGGAFPTWVSACISSPMFMYIYQIMEGTFHLMIVFGGLRAFRKKSWPPPKQGDRQLSLFRWGLWLELLVMDIAYVVAYSCLPMMSLPGHWGLTTIMMLIHHINVLPDLVCAWHEWKADRAAKITESTPEPALA